MARRKTEPATPSFTPGEAAFILESLIDDRKLTSKQLADYRNRYKSEISALEARLARLREMSGPAALGAAIAATGPALARRIGRTASRVTKRVRKAAKQASAAVSPERIRTRQMQGQYLGYMRQIPRIIVKQRFGKDAIKAKGKAAVIAEMEAYLSKQKKG